MSKKQEALIRAIKAAQEAGGFLQKQLAAMACTSPGNICSALSGAGSMSVEKWRLLCEGLALDYDAIIAETENTPAAEVQQEEPVRCESAAPVCEEIAPVCEEIAPECESPVKISGGGYRVGLPGAQASGGFAQRYGDADRRDVRAAGLHAGAEEVVK